MLEKILYYLCLTKRRILEKTKTIYYKSPNPSFGFIGYGGGVIKFIRPLLNISIYSNGYIFSRKAEIQTDLIYEDEVVQTFTTKFGNDFKQAKKEYDEYDDKDLHTKKFSEDFAKKLDEILDKMLVDLYAEYYREKYKNRPYKDNVGVTSIGFMNFNSDGLGKIDKDKRHGEGKVNRSTEELIDKFGGDLKRAMDEATPKDITKAFNDEFWKVFSEESDKADDK